MFVALIVVYVVGVALTYFFVGTTLFLLATWEDVTPPERWLAWGASFLLPLLWPLWVPPVFASYWFVTWRDRNA